MLTIFANQLLAQTGTTGIFFQAVARDNYSNPAKERKIYVQSSIIQTTTNGTSLLVEEYQVNTDGAGMFSISIGNGIRVGGAATGLNAIDWSQGPFYLNLKIAITPITGSTGWDYKKEWVDIGTTSFGAVPYALYSANTAGLNQKLNITDTTKMLAPYVRTTNVTSLTTSVASNTASITSLNTSVASNTASITSLNTSVASNTASISSLTTSVASNTASISSLTTSVASNTASISSLTSSVASNTASITSTVPYTGATGSVNLGAYNLTVNSLSIGVPSSGIQNTMFGYAPFVNGTPGDNNTAIGFATLQSLNGGNDNTAVGTNAIRQGAIGGGATGSRNTALGSAALSNGNVPSDNTAIGYNTLSVVTGGANTAVGSGALLANTTGSNNTAIGYSANVGSGTLSNATAIGAGAIVSTSNTIQLGNTSVTDVKTSGTLTAGAVTYPKTHGTSGQVLSTTGSGTLTFTSISSFTHYIGENYGGGIIVHLWKTSGVEHGLIAAKQDASTGIAWSTITSGTSSATSYTDGQSNTNLIIAQNSGGASAAKVCADYTVTEGGVIYDDWYLPSAAEYGFINQIAYTFEFYGGDLMLGTYLYHTSTETGISQNIVYYTTYYKVSSSKGANGRVKAMRRF